MSHQFWLEIAYVMDSENEEMIVAAKRVAPAARERQMRCVHPAQRREYSPRP